MYVNVGTQGQDGKDKCWKMEDKKLKFGNTAVCWAVFHLLM